MDSARGGSAESTDGLRQGRVLARVLFNILLAAMLFMAAKFFFDGPDAAKALVSIVWGDEPAALRNDGYG